MSEDDMKRKTEISDEVFPESEESRTEAIRRAAALAAEDAQRAIKEIKARSEALKRDILLHAGVDLGNEETS